MGNQTKMVGEDLYRQYKLADETAGCNTPEKVKDDTNEHIFYYCKGGFCLDSEATQVLSKRSQ